MTAWSDNNPTDSTPTIATDVSRPHIYVRGRDVTDVFEELEAALAIEAKRKQFFPTKTRAALPEMRPVQAPPRQPTKHLLHFANPRVWTRRNRPGI